jgi:hypothetical protein
VAVAILAIAVLASAVGASAAKAPAVRIGTAELTPVLLGGPEGVAYMRQKGQRLTGWLVVWGLEPGSSHAWHVHGPNGACTPSSANKGVIVGGPDLVANEDGVAYQDFTITSPRQVIAKGFYVNVHEKSTPDGVGGGITCGNIARVSLR